MTAQIAETLHYDGLKLSMCSTPLSDYFTFASINPSFESNCTALWRGYVGTWEIVNDRLYLIELNGMLLDGTEASLETFFPNFPDRVFAHWYTGEIRVPQGKMLESVHAGFLSKYESDLIFVIEKGVVKETKVVQNGESDDVDAPEGYGVGAMTFYPPSNKNKETKL
jgi:hypothetical protein